MNHAHDFYAVGCHLVKDDVIGVRHHLPQTGNSFADTKKVGMLRDRDDCCRQQILHATSGSRIFTRNIGDNFVQVITSRSPPNDRQHSIAPLRGYFINERPYLGHQLIVRYGGPRINQAGRNLGFQPSRIAGFLLCSLELRGERRKISVHVLSLDQNGNFRHF